MSKLEFYGGDGYYGVPLHGNFEVRTDNKNYNFSNLEEAKLFYDSLNVGKALWYYKAGSELLEAHNEVDDDYVEDYEEMPF